jgi:CDP-glucose 4,6-dehydratase
VPDCTRAWSEGKPVVIRNPSSTRPWQHVLEPLSGYLVLGQKLFQGDARVKNQAFNFGPQAQVNQSVSELITAMTQFWSNAELNFQQETNSKKPESTLLKLNCDKALQILGWEAVLNFEETIRMTGEWYQKFYKPGPSSISKITSGQIKKYFEKASKLNLSWTQ